MADAAFAHFPARGFCMMRSGLHAARPTFYLLNIIGKMRHSSPELNNFINADDDISAHLKFPHASFCALLKSRENNASFADLLPPR